MKWLQRRWWCSRLGHPQAKWAPIVIHETFPARLNADGSITDEIEILTRSYRCARHDRKEME